MVRSWIIVYRDTAIAETWNRKIAEAVNAGGKYKAIPVVKWLHRINMEIRNEAL